MTIDSMSNEKQKKTTKETLEHFIALAMSLEITEVKDELADKCIKEKSPNQMRSQKTFSFIVDNKTTISFSQDFQNEIIQAYKQLK